MILFAAAVLLCVLVILAFVLGYRWLVSHERRHFGGTCYVRARDGADTRIARWAAAVVGAARWFTRPIDWSQVLRRGRA